MVNDPGALLTMDEAAEMLDLTKSRVRQISQEGGPLHRVRIDGKTFVERAAVEQYASERKHHRPYPRKAKGIPGVMKPEKTRARKSKDPVGVILDRMEKRLQEQKADLVLLRGAMKRHDLDLRANIAEEVRRG